MRVRDLFLANAFPPSDDLQSFSRPLVVRFFLIVLLSMSALLSGCVTSSARHAESRETLVFASGVELAYSGTISFEANQRLFELAESLVEEPSALVITSNGGDIVAGMELGRWVFESGLDVRVPDYCMSSCANYVFVAGARKILAREASLMWHGGATQRFEISCETVAWERSDGVCDEEKLRAIAMDSLAEFIAVETEFFESIEVDQRITTLGQLRRFACARGEGYTGWYYSIPDMAALGVDRISVIGGEWRPTIRSPDFKLCRVDLGSRRTLNPEP